MAARVFGGSFLLVLCLGSWVGCGPNVSLKGVFPVSGALTLDGQPFTEADLIFLPQATTGEPRSGRATTDAQGKFRVTTLQPNDGLYPGEYKVMVNKILYEPTVSPDEAKRLNEQGKQVPPDKETELAPKPYTSPTTTPMIVTIGPKGEKDLKIELKSTP